MIDPEGLTDEVERIAEAPMPGFPGLSRLVRRNDGAVRAVLVNGAVAWESGAPSNDLGKRSGFGRVLRARFA